MVRLLLILIFAGICAVLAIMVWSTFRSWVQQGGQRLQSVQSAGEGNIMGSTGIQKAAFIALIVLLFGVASGLLGGL